MATGSHQEQQELKRRKIIKNKKFANLQILGTFKALFAKKVYYSCRKKCVFLILYPEAASLQYTVFFNKFLYLIKSKILKAWNKDCNNGNEKNVCKIFKPW